MKVKFFNKDETSRKQDEDKLGRMKPKTRQEETKTKKEA